MTDQQDLRALIQRWRDEGIRLNGGADKPYTHEENSVRAFVLGCCSDDLENVLREAAAQLPAGVPDKLAGAAGVGLNFRERGWKFSASDMLGTIVVTYPDGRELELQKGEVGSVKTAHLLDDMAKALSAPQPDSQKSGEGDGRRFRGVGELERTGYIPAGSAAEREKTDSAAPGGDAKEVPCQVCGAQIFAWPDEKSAVCLHCMADRGDVEQRAREFLADEYSLVEDDRAAGRIRRGNALHDEKIALRAIIAALSAPKQVEAQPLPEALVPASALRELYHGYVKTLEAGRDRIQSLGGHCDTVQFMEEGDLALRKARAILAAPQPAPQPVEAEGRDTPPPGSYEAAMVVIERDSDGTPTIWCDPEVVDLVTALNTNRLRTVASCSGHGHRPGFIALKDGRVLLVCSSLDEAQKADHVWPDINGITRVPEQPAIDLEQFRPAATCYLAFVQAGGNPSTIADAKQLIAIIDGAKARQEGEEDRG